MPLNPIFPVSNAPSAPTYTLFVGPAAYEKEVIGYVRSQLADEDGFEYPDTVFQQAVDEVVTDFSRFKAAEIIVGDVVANTSPLTTVSNQRQYATSSINGFATPPLMVSDVLYRSAGYMANVSEYSYMSMMSMSPLGRFFQAPYAIDSPTIRLLINEYAQEATKWGQGYWRSVNGPSGLMIELLPVPASSGSPIFVRYLAQHPATTVSGVDHYHTIPQLHWRDFAMLLQAQVMEREGMRALRRGQMIKVGLNSRNIDAKLIMDEVTDLRQRAYSSLGGTRTVASISE